MSVANLKAAVYGIPQVRDRQKIKAIVDTIVVPDFEPRAGVKIEVTETEAAASSNNPESPGLCFMLYGLIIFVLHVGWVNHICVSHCVG